MTKNDYEPIMHHVLEEISRQWRLVGHVAAHLARLHQAKGHTRDSRVAADIARAARHMQKAARALNLYTFGLPEPTYVN